MAATSDGLRVFVALNPRSGGATARDVREVLDRYFACADGSCVIHEVDARDDVADRVRQAIRQGARLVVAAGGDGTVSAVASGLVHAPVPLGILPLGTANVLAGELGVPQDVNAACALLAGPHATQGLDAMRVGDRLFFTQIGVGIDALMIRDTPHEHKRRFGRIAYVWTALVHLLGFQPRRFRVEVDGRRVRARASEVLVANGGVLGLPPFRWGPDIRPDDGRVDVCIIRARTLIHFAILTWHFLTGQHKRSPNVRYFVAERHVAIQARRPLPVQADGEIIGDTPVSIQVVPHAVQVVVPARGEPRAPELPSEIVPSPA